MSTSELTREKLIEELAQLVGYLGAKDVLQHLDSLNLAIVQKDNAHGPAPTKTEA